MAKQWPFQHNNRPDTVLLCQLSTTRYALGIQTYEYEFCSFVETSIVTQHSQQHFWHQKFIDIFFYLKGSWPTLLQTITELNITNPVKNICKMIGAWTWQIQAAERHPSLGWANHVKVSAELLFYYIIEMWHVKIILFNPFSGTLYFFSNFDALIWIMSGKAGWRSQLVWQEDKHSDSQHTSSTKLKGQIQEFWWCRFWLGWWRRFECKERTSVRALLNILTPSDLQWAAIC